MINTSCWLNDRKELIATYPQHWQNINGYLESLTSLSPLLFAVSVSSNSI